MENPDFHALLLNTNYRSLVYDLSNATNLNNLGGFYDETEEQFHRLLMHEKLDTLTLGVNYFRGSLPTFLNSDGTVEAGRGLLTLCLCLQERICLACFLISSTLPSTTTV